MTETPNAPGCDFVRKSVGIFVSSRRIHLPGRQKRGVLSVKQLVTDQGIREGKKVTNCRISASSRSAAIRQRAIIRTRVLRIPLRHVTDRAIRNRLIFWQRIRRVHSCGMEDVFANILVVILAARFLYDSSKQNETIVGVVPMATGLECGVPRTVKLDVQS